MGSEITEIEEAEAVAECPLPTTPCSRPLAPRGGNDRVWTPASTARIIVDHFKPTGRILEPCRGAGAFTSIIPNCDWCEIDEGRDFLAVEGYWDWVVTNPPWSQFRPFLAKSMQVADNVVFLALLNAWFMRARVRDMRQAGFGLVEAMMIDTPPRPWPQTGFQLAAVHARRAYDGPLNFHYANAPAHRRRANGGRLPTEARSRDSVQPAGWAGYGILSKSAILAPMRPTLIPFSCSFLVALPFMTSSAIKPTRGMKARMM